MSDKKFIVIKQESGRFQYSDLDELKESITDKYKIDPVWSNFFNDAKHAVNDAQKKHGLCVFLWF